MANPWLKPMVTPNVTDPTSRVLRLPNGGPTVNGTKNQMEPIAAPKNNIQGYGTTDRCRL
jgi:hypothetical protein